MSKAHLAVIAALSCIVCSIRPVQCHHAVGGSIFVRLGPRGRHKHSDFLALPLCHAHHQGKQGIHTLGVQTWEAQFARQAAMIDKLCDILKVNLWQLAKQETEERRAKRKNKPISKVMPRRHV